MNEKCYIHNIFLGDKVLMVGKKVMSMVYPDENHNILPPKIGVKNIVKVLWT